MSGMSYFSTTLTRLLKDRTQSEIAKASGLPRSTIANYAIDTSGITVSALGQLLQAFPDHEDQMDLVRAHLRDEIPASIYDRVEIRTSGGTLREDRPPAAWQKELDRAIDALRSAAECNEDVRRLILDLEKVI